MRKIELLKKTTLLLRKKPKTDDLIYLNFSGVNVELNFYFK